MSTRDWLPERLDEAAPRYRAIASALADDITAGRLAPGDRLPPQRSLARSLDVDLTTITKAFNEVRKLGLIEGDGRRGSFVRAKLPDAVSLSDDAPDTGMNLPPEPANGTLAERYRRTVADILSAPSSIARLRYQPSGGSSADRMAGAALFDARGVATAEDQVIVTSGAQNALHAILNGLCATGDTIACQRFVYPGFLGLARRLGLVLAPVASDDEGLEPDAFDAACRHRTVKAVYLVPTNDNPTTATMSEARRRAIAAIADRHGVAIIEDDAYGQLPEQQIAPIAAILPERTWHIASVSKIISPGLRIAYVRAPSIPAAWDLAADVHETTIMAPPLNAALIAAWLRDGSFGALVEEVRREARGRQLLVANILKNGAYRAHPEGYHLWLPLADSVAAGAIVDALRPAGLSAVPSNAFAVDPADRQEALRISIGGSLSVEGLRRALHRLDALLVPGGGRSPSMV